MSGRKMNERKVDLMDRTGKVLPYLSDLARRIIRVAK